MIYIPHTSLGGSVQHKQASAASTYIQPSYQLYRLHAAPPPNFCFTPPTTCVVRRGANLEDLDTRARSV